jgi:hypothetical protein
LEAEKRIMTAGKNKEYAGIAGTANEYKECSIQ